MTKKLPLTIIAFFCISISISFAQGSESARTAPLPGSPEPIYPPGCVAPAVPLVSFYVSNGQTLPGLLCWKAISGAIGYRVYLTKSGSTTAILFAKISSSAPHPYNLYSCVYNTLPIGSYNFFVQSYSSGCSSGWSKPFPITIAGEPIQQDIDPGNDPYAVDLMNLLLDYSNVGNERMATSPNDAPSKSIYPNPVSGTLNVSLPFKLCSRDKVLVNDINGRSVNNVSISISSEGSAQIETSNISPGIYFLTVTSGYNNFKQRFIKN